MPTNKLTLKLTPDECYQIRLTNGKWVIARYTHSVYRTWVSKTHYMFVNQETERVIEIKSFRRIKLLPVSE